MSRKGLGLVELLVAIAVGVAVMGGAFLALRQTARSLSTEQKIALSQDQAARVLQGLLGEFKNSPAAFLLPGASESGVGLVVLSGTGWPVIAEGYGPDRVRVTGGRPDLRAGTPVALVSPTGEAFYVPGLGSATAVDARAGVYELGFAGCQNPLRFVQGMRAYRVELVTVTKTAGGLELRGANPGTQQVLTLKDFTFRYVYASPTGETTSPAYRGASLPDGSRLVALAFQATGTTEADRAYTGRLPVGAGNVEIRDVFVCGGTPPPPPGEGVVTVVIDPAPPGGGDVTLLANGYTRTMRQSSTFRDVPVGEVRVQAREVWTDSLTAWAPNPVEQQGTLYTFAPLTFVVSYSIAPATLVFSVSGLPSDGRATVSAGPYSASVGGGASQTVPASPGVYGTSASPEVSVSRSQGSVSWTEVYALQSVSPAQVTVRSYGSASVAAAYTGPLPGTLCYDGSCRQAPPGRYAAPAEEVIRTWTETRTRGCPSGYRGSITVTERWRTVKRWTPSAGGLSSRGTLRFTSATRDEMMDRAESRNCVPIEPPTATQADPTQPPQPPPTQTIPTQPTERPPTQTIPTQPTQPGFTTVPGPPPTIPPDLTTLSVGPTGDPRPTGPNPTRPNPTRPPTLGPTIIPSLTRLPPGFTTLYRPDLTGTDRSPSENNNDRGGGQPTLNPSGSFNPRTSLFGLGHDRFGSERPKPRYLLPLPWALDAQL